MKQIKINGVQADIPKLPIAINWEYLNLSEPGKKFAPYTSSMTLPYTAKNKSLLGFGDVVGGNMTKIRSVPTVDYVVANNKIIDNGTFKILTSDKEGYKGTVTSRNSNIEAIEAFTIDDAIDYLITNFSYSTYSSAIESLRIGYDTGKNPGFILPRSMTDPITSSVWSIYDTTNKYTHEIWCNVYSVLKALVDNSIVTFKVWQGGAFITLESSILYAHLCKMYFPVWNLVLRENSDWILDIASGERLIAGELVQRSIFKTMGGKTSWEFIKAISQLFCCSIYMKGTEISFIPLNEITSAGAIDMSNKSANPVKYFTIPGHGSKNYIQYKNTDNLPEDFARMTVISPVTPSEEKELLTFDMMLPGKYFTNAYTDPFFNTNYNDNRSLADSPMVLYDSGITNYTKINHGTNTKVDVLLKTLSYFDFNGWYAMYQLVSTIGLVYDFELKVDSYTLTRLVPYKLIRINELGGHFYINKITGYDPDSGKLAKCQIVKWGVMNYSLSPASIVFLSAYDTKTITVISNIPWRIVAQKPYVVMSKMIGGGNDTVDVYTFDDTFSSETIEFSFANTVISVILSMVSVILNSITSIPTQSTEESFTPQPSFSATADAGQRTIFWGLYEGGTMVSSGSQTFTFTSGTATYSFSGILTPATPGIDYVFKIGLFGHTISSNTFEIAI